MSLCFTCLSAINLTFWSDFTHRCLSAPESNADTPVPHATLNSATPALLLREWAKARLVRDPWRDVLLSAASVSILCAFAPVEG